MNKIYCRETNSEMWLFRILDYSDYFTIKIISENTQQIQDTNCIFMFKKLTDIIREEQMLKEKKKKHDIKPSKIHQKLVWPQI